MQTFSIHITQWLMVVIAIAFIVHPGCDEDISPPEMVEPFQFVSLGSYESGDRSCRGVIMLDVENTGNTLTGEAVVRSRTGEDIFRHLYLRGTTNGSDILLNLDTDRIPYQDEFTVEATIEAGSGLTGTFFYSADSLAAAFESDILKEADAVVDSFIDLNVTTLGLAYDGDHIWVSTSLYDHFLMSLDGTVVDTIAVLMNGDAHWTSDALTSDGTVLWGQYPVTVYDGGQVRNESRIQEFTKEGVITRSFQIPHRATGLAHDGSGLWSVSTESDSLYRIDAEGTILESIGILLPDIVDIEYGGGYFWGVGWFMQRLYQIDGAGEVVCVYHLPGESGNIFPSGIAFDGEHFWYSFCTTYLDSRIYRLSVGP